ncbi:hypothetical protein ARMSODRAFT_966843 [Armillaria solidipes]|uniref:Uncharacterized protein n=1 Tax=Armillaria solidipes TaxID=1076256 RepID=A0A2H3B6H0_9AGAR|nr:hypothetical protein ARMSODRAFT_966843 [Armillaria solidipes]
MSTLPARRHPQLPLHSTSLSSSTIPPIVRYDFCILLEIGCKSTSGHHRKIARPKSYNEHGLAYYGSMALSSFALLTLLIVTDSGGNACVGDIAGSREKSVEGSSRHDAG